MTAGSAGQRGQPEPNGKPRMREHQQDGHSPPNLRCLALNAFENVFQMQDSRENHRMTCSPLAFYVY